MSESFLVTGIVLVAAAYLVIRAVRQARATKEGCGCGSDSCPAESETKARRS